MDLTHETELKKPFYSLIHTNRLPGRALNSHRAGYLSPDGEFLECHLCEHVHMLKTCFNALLPLFLESCSKRNIKLDPYTSPLEEFFMVELGYVKISGIVDTSESVLNSDDLKYIWFYEWVYPLTEKQLEFLLPV